MYEAFFNLAKSPFGMNPDPNCLFMTQSHREALAGLLYAVSRRKGFVVLTGDAGTGKTSLLRTLILSAENAKFSLILTPRVSSDEFLELILLDFGVTDVPASKSQRIHKLQELLIQFRTHGQAPVLVVDEAHTLSPDALEEIRLLTNLETTEQKLLQIVLAGQNDLTTLLNREDLRQLKQRIEVRMDLKPLAEADVASYMLYRWNAAGGSAPPPFRDDAIALISRASRGIPRVVNCICDNALLLAFADQEAVVGVAHISHVLRDFDLASPETAPRRGLGLALLRRSGSEETTEQRSSISPRTILGLRNDESPRPAPAPKSRRTDANIPNWSESKSYPK